MEGGKHGQEEEAVKAIFSIDQFVLNVTFTKLLNGDKVSPSLIKP